MTGKVRHHHVLVPVSDVDRANGVTAPWTKEQVESAPDYGAPEAYRHYGIEPAAAP